MKLLRKWILLVIPAMFLLIPASRGLAQDTMVLVANQASLVKAQPWIDFLKKNEINVEHFVPSDFGSVKTRKFITIMGGMNDEAIKKLVTEVVGSAEASALDNKGAKKMFMKENVWWPGQKVLIFAGSDAEAADAGRVESREIWMKYLKEWFDLGEGPGGLKAY